MSVRATRRDVLKLGGAAAASMAMAPVLESMAAVKAWKALPIGTQARCVRKQLASVHFGPQADYTAVPPPLETAYMDWSLPPFNAGYHAWAAHYNVCEVQQKIRKPSQLIEGADADIFIVGEAFSNDQAWVEGTFIPTVQKRGAAIIEARGVSSAASAANAAIDHVRDWVLGTNEWVSMGVPSDGSYGIPEGLVFGFPCTTSGGKYTIVKGVEHGDFAKGKIAATQKELNEERAAIEHLLKG
jgi:hypothetical protein